MPNPDSRSLRRGTPAAVLAAAAVLAVAVLVPAGVTAIGAPPVPDGGRTTRAACVTALACAASASPEGPWRFAGARGVAVDHRGRVLVADTGSHRVLVFSADGVPEDEFGGYGWTESRLDGPTDLAVVPGFYVDVLDRGNRRVQRFDVEGDYVDTVVGEGEVEDPVALAVGRSGEILVLDASSQSVMVFSQFGEPMPSIGRFGAGEGGLARPAGIAVGPRGEIAVADPGRGSVEVFDEFGGHLRSLTGADSLRAVAVAFDRYGNLLAADEKEGAVLAFSPSGRITARLDADHLGAPFHPADLAVGQDGHLVVLDGADGRVLTVTMEYDGDCSAP